MKGIEIEPHTGTRERTTIRVIGVAMCNNHPGTGKWSRAIEFSGTGTDPGETSAMLSELVNHTLVEAHAQDANGSCMVRPEIRMAYLIGRDRKG